MEKEIDRDKCVLDEKISVIIELLMIILDCVYSDAYHIIIQSKTYKYMENLDYATLHDSPQANLSDIGSELRERNHPLGDKITDENIKKAVLYLRSLNKKKH